MPHADKNDGNSPSYYRATIALMRRTIAIRYDGAMRETEKIGPPWEMELVRERGRLVEVTIRSTSSAGLDLGSVTAATNEVMGRLRRERRNLVDGAINSESIARMREAYEAAGGKMTPEYLAHLAVAYAEIVAKGGRAVMPALAAAIDGKTPTVKGHVVKARQEGYLTDATFGREGGEPTQKALDLVNQV